MKKRRITVSVQAIVYVPEDTPSNDYVRAIGNYLADKLGSLPSTDATFNHGWRPGREVEIIVDGAISSENGIDQMPSYDAQQGSLL